MLPVFLGIGAAIGSAITAGQALTIGAGIGAATAVGVNMMTSSQGRQRHEPRYEDDSDEINEIVERLVRQRLAKAGRKRRNLAA